MLALLTLLAASMATVVHVAAVAVVGRALGARVDEVQVLTGGGLTLRAAAPRIRVGWLPVGGFVRFVGAGEPAVADGYEALPGWRRALVPLAGPVAVLFVASALLGPGEALASSGRLPGQYLAGVRPFGAAQEVLAGWAALAGAPVSVVAGHVFAKLGALNLLPVGALAGGQALLALVPLPERASTVYQGGSLLVVVGLGVGWVVAVVGWLA